MREPFMRRSRVRSFRDGMIALRPALVFSRRRRIVSRLGTMGRALGIVLSIALALAACGGGDEPSTPRPSSPATGTRPSSSAKLSFVEPQYGATVKGPAVAVRLNLTGGRLLEKASRTITSDTGHVHVALDGKTVTLLAGLEYTLEDVAPGQHLIRAEFAAADHGSFDPPVLADMRITVT